MEKCGYTIKSIRIRYDIGLLSPTNRKEKK